ncbi:class I SAM-dependent methyltransferase [Streptomyces sp. NPDC017979]|uniref:class I SAM-dependent methyltransferase n=1 Tax=Streptomyces sp. NPDC017979 TaxID=3365024 RepID=UPI0037A0A541
MTHEMPLAYLLGLEGLALLRTFTGEYDREFAEARIAEVRRMLDDERLAHTGVEVDRLDPREGYRIWAQTYDSPNSAFDTDGPALRDVLDGLPAGTALDAACGTGRVSVLLAERGHAVIGVDGSPEMLARARERVAGGEFRPGDLHSLPVADGSVDLVVCALALTHVPDLGPVLAEFARVLRPGGHLVTSDVHPEQVARSAVPTVRDGDGRPGRLASHVHRIGDYVRAALAAGFAVRRCEEPRPVAARPRIPEAPGGLGAAVADGPWELWPWSLAALVPDATEAASADVPGVVVWHFQLPGE